MAKARSSRNPFGTRAFQSGDVRPALIGASVGVLTLLGIWALDGRGLSVGWLLTIEGSIVAFAVGLPILLLKKRRWTPRARWTTELLGAALTGPLCVFFLLLGVWPLPIGEIGDEDWSDGVAPQS